MSTLTASDRGESMTENTTTRPVRRTRATPKTATEPTTPTPAKPVAAKSPRAKATPAPAAVTQAVDDDGREVFVFDLVFERETKSYAAFKPPVGSGCVGTLYFPLGTRDVRVRMTGGPAA